MKKASTQVFVLRERWSFRSPNYGFLGGRWPYWAIPFYPSRHLGNGIARQSSKQLCNGESIANQWEGEAPAELNTLWFGRSLTLPSKEWIGQSRGKNVYRGGLTLPMKLQAIPTGTRDGSTPFGKTMMQKRPLGFGQMPLCYRTQIRNLSARSSINIPYECTCFWAPQS